MNGSMVENNPTQDHLVTAAEIRGTAGYAEDTDALVARYESIAPEDIHAAILHLLPPAPSDILDIGAGSGRDAAWLAARGHRVVAIEPTAALRLRAQQLHRSSAIAFIDDSLPELAVVRRQDRRFALVMMTAVFMHLDADERRRAMPNLAGLIDDDGRLAITLRHGPVPPGRRMFEVSSEETIALARRQGLRVLVNTSAPSTQTANRDAGVTWTVLAFGARSSASAQGPL